MGSGPHDRSIAPRILRDPEIVPPRPVEASPETAPRGPLALIGTYLIGFAMGGADVVPGFSGGTVALVAGIYERLVANVRQGAHVLSLLVRGRAEAALRAFVVIDWPFVAALLAGIGTAILVLSATLGELLERFPMAMSAAFLGLVLGAAAVAQRELRSPAWYHAVIAIAVGALVFVGLGWSPGTIEDPSLLLVFGAVAVAACAMILPGVSGSFLLLVLGMYTAVVAEGFGGRDVTVMLTAVLGAATGLALFSTALNYLLRRWHDLILAALLGLMLGSARVLWPWPPGLESPELAAPTGNDWLLALSVGLTAFAIVWLLALVVPSSKEAAAKAQARSGAVGATTPPSAEGPLDDWGGVPRHPHRFVGPDPLGHTSDLGPPPPDPLTDTSDLGPPRRDRAPDDPRADHPGSPDDGFDGGDARRWPDPPEPPYGR